MYPDKKRIKLIAYGSLLFCLTIIVDIFYFHFVDFDQNSIEKQQKLLTILIMIAFYPFFAWEYLYNKQWKFAFFIAFILIAATFIDEYLMRFFYNEYHVFNQNFYLLRPLTSIFSWCGLVYGFTKGGWKDGLGGFIIGTLFNYLLIKLQFGNILHYRINLDDSIVTLVFALIFNCFTYSSLAFTYYYLLNYYTNKNKLIDSFTVEYKKYTLKESLFFPSFIFLYTGFFITLLSLGNNRFIMNRFNFEGIQMVSIIYLILVVIVLFAIMHSLSNLIIQKLYQLKISIGLTYLFLFVPIINIFILIHLYRKEKSIKSNPNLSTVKNIEKFENEDYKKIVIVLNVVAYIVTFALTGFEYSKTGLTITIAFYVINIAFLAGLYYYKYAGVGILLSLCFLTFFRFYYNIADETLIIQSLVSGIMLTYLYTQSFHPISLDITNPAAPNEAETNPTEIA